MYQSTLLRLLPGSLNGPIKERMTRDVSRDILLAAPLLEQQQNLRVGPVFLEIGGRLSSVGHHHFSPVYHRRTDGGTENPGLVGLGRNLAGGYFIWFHAVQLFDVPIPGGENGVL